MLSVSLSAQLAVMPLLIFYFNQFSVVSLLANLVVVPLATVILYTGFCFFLFGGLEFIAGYTASMLQWMSSFLEWFTLSLSSLPGACVDGLSLIPLQVFVIFFTGIFLLLYLRSRSVRSFILLLSGVILFLAITCVREYRILTHHRFYVFSLSRETAIGFVRGRQITLFRGFDPGEDKDTLPYELISFFKRYKLYPPLSFSVSDSGLAVAEFPLYRYIYVA